MALRSDDLMRLGPAAQKQIMQKLSENKPYAGQTDKANKYHSQKAERLTEDGKVITFDSQKEARRYDELMLLLKHGKIQDLKLQPQFTLQEAYTTPEGQRVMAIRYQADFSYKEPAAGSKGTMLDIVEDVKSPATKTRVYAIKRKMMAERFGVIIREI